MTDLQASLFIIGGAIVGGVISYNKWQEYKARKTLEQAFPSSHDDVLMTPDAQGGDFDADGRRQEPSIYNAPMDEPEADPYGGDSYTPSQPRQQFEKNEPVFA